MIKNRYDIITNILKLWRHFNARRKLNFFILLILSLVTAFAEVISLGTVLPFLTALTAPESLFKADFMQIFLRMLEVKDPEGMLLPLTIIFISAALISGVMRLLQLYMNTLVSASVGAELSIKVYSRSLYQPYSTHLKQNSSAIINAVATKVPLITNGTIFPLISMISSSLILSGILLTLLLIDPVVTLSIIIGFGSIYFLIFLFTRPILKRNGEVIAKESTIMVKTMQEGIGGIRDVIIDNAQKIYQQVHADAVLPLRRAQALNQFIGMSPRFGIEAIGIAMIGGIAFLLVGQGDNFENGLPILGTIVFGAQRMLPALQTVFVSWSAMQGNAQVAADVIEFLDQPLKKHSPHDANILPFNNNIILRDLYFRYEDNGPDIINNVNLSILKGRKIGFIGTTGSGKSTLLDIIMGLIQPTKGNLLVDGLVVDESCASAWQRNIAHVPQSIFLSDSSIKENIAFGIPAKKIDFDRVKWAAQQAHMHNLIDSWPDKYNTFVGERGVRLSGGQLQRIGIARAIYKKASLIVLDEATSALDLKTEQLIVDTIDGMEDGVTILIISHRLESLKGCDEIFSISEVGSIKSVGGYAEFLCSLDT